jgi:hypothetical protein
MRTGETPAAPARCVHRARREPGYSSRPAGVRSAVRCAACANRPKAPFDRPACQSGKASPFHCSPAAPDCRRRGACPEQPGQEAACIRPVVSDLRIQAQHGERPRARGGSRRRPFIERQAEEPARDPLSSGRRPGAAGLAARVIRRVAMRGRPASHGDGAAGPQKSHWPWQPVPGPMMTKTRRRGVGKAGIDRRPKTTCGRPSSVCSVTFP